MGDVREAIKQAFEEVDCEPDHGALELLEGASSTYRKGATSLARQFEAYLLNRKLDAGPIRSSDASAFIAHLASCAKAQPSDRRSGFTAPSEPTPNPPFARRNDSTPGTTDAFATESVQPGTTPFGTRKRRREASCEIESAHSYFSDDSDIAVDVLPLPRGSLNGAVYMAERVIDRAEAQESRILRMADTLLALEHQPFSDDISAPTHCPARCVGRIVPELEPELDETSVLVEGSLKHSAGARVRLNLDQLTSFALFPGQVVGLEGVNPIGKSFSPTRLITSAPAPLDRSPIAQEDHKRSFVEDNDGPFTMLVAAGPFTCSGDLAYEPLHELVEYAREDKPAVVVLLGPFVDSDHPKIRDGLVDAQFQEIFEEAVGKCARELVQEVGCQVVLVPSMRDAHMMPVFPQAPLELKDTPGTENVVQLSNPGHARIGGASCSFIGADPIKSITASELRRPKRDGGYALWRTSHFLYGQQHLYPRFPPPERCPIDHSHSDTHCAMHGRSPELLVAPSDLNAFAKVVPLETWEHTSSGERKPGVRESSAAGAQAGEAPNGDTSTHADRRANNVAADRQDGSSKAAHGNTLSPKQDVREDCMRQSEKALVVNPGRLAKGPNGGTLARVRVASSSAIKGVSEDNQSDTWMCKDDQRRQFLLADRARIDLIRL